MNIRTTYEFPPIPVRDHDWSALVEPYEAGDVIGYGPTEQAAIDDLVQQSDLP